MKKQEMKSLALNLLEQGATKPLKKHLEKKDAKQFEAFSKVFNIHLQKKLETEFCKSVSEAAKKRKISVKKAVANGLKIRQMQQSFSTGHSMGSLVSFDVLGVTAYECDTTQNYANSCQWKAKHGFHSVSVDAGILYMLDDYFYACIGGVDTFIHKADVNKKVKRCITFQEVGEKAKFNIEFLHGFVTSNFHAKTESECLLWRKKQALRLANARHSNLPLEKRLALQGNRSITFEDSIRAGNCVAGTKAFCARHGLDETGAYPLNEILSLEQSAFTLRLLK